MVRAAAERPKTLGIRVRRGPLRMQVCDLTISDLSSAPVWEFDLDEEGIEGQVRGNLCGRTSSMVLRIWAISMLVVSYALPAGAWVQS